MPNLFMSTFVFHGPIVVCNGLLVITPRSAFDGFGMWLKSKITSHYYGLCYNPRSL